MSGQQQQQQQPQPQMGMSSTTNGHGLYPAPAPAGKLGVGLDGIDAFSFQGFTKADGNEGQGGKGGQQQQQHQHQQQSHLQYTNLPLNQIPSKRELLRDWLVVYLVSVPSVGMSSRWW